MQLHIPAQVLHPLAQRLTILEGNDGVLGIPHTETQTPHTAIVQLLQFPVGDSTVHHGNPTGIVRSKFLNGIQQTSIVHRKGLGLNKDRSRQV